MAQSFISANLGTCVRKKVGCTLTKKTSRGEYILTTNYNGVTSGHPHCTDSPCEGSKYDNGEGLEECNAIHAEINALLNCNPNEVYAAYITCFPCKKCAEVLLNTSIKKVYYCSNYARMEETEKLFYIKGIDLHKILPEEVSHYLSQVKELL